MDKQIHDNPPPPAYNQPPPPGFVVNQQYLAHQVTAQPYPPYPANPQVYHPHQHQNPAPSVVHVTKINYGSSKVRCDKCENEVFPAISYKSGGFTWLMCFIIFLFAPIGCCLIPFCINGFKDEKYKCPICDHKLYELRRC